MKETTSTINLQEGKWGRKHAFTIGYGFIAMIVLAFFSEFAIRGQMINWSDPGATLANIAAAPGLFAMGIASFVVILLLDIAIAFAFHGLFKAEAPGRSVFTLTLRLIYVAIKATALTGLYLALQLVRNSKDSSELMDHLHFHDTGFAVGLIFFGFHLIYLSKMMCDGRVPRWLCYLMFLAGIGYVLNSFAQLNLSDDSQTRAIIMYIFMLPMTIAELSFGIWLLVKRNKLSSYFSF